MVDPSCSLVLESPSMEQLLVLLAERDVALTQRDALIAALAGRVGSRSWKRGWARTPGTPPSHRAAMGWASRHRSRYKPSGRRPGKQQADQGFRLQPRAVPDEVRTHVPTGCNGCGTDLTCAPVVGVGTRQVFDLPVIELVAIEHRAQRRACACGVVTRAAFPAEATSPTCYGPGVAALAVYNRTPHCPTTRPTEPDIAYSLLVDAD